MIYVSHRLDEIFRIADRVTVLRDGRNVGTRAVRETTSGDLVVMIVGRPLDDVFLSAPEATATPMLEVRDLRIDRVGPISFRVKKGEIVGLAGLRGAGQSAADRALAGIVPIDGGDLRLDGAAFTPRTPQGASSSGVAFATSNREEESLAMTFTVTENLFLNPAFRQRHAWQAMTDETERKAARELIDTFSIRPPDPERTIGTLSGGNQQKAVLARWARHRRAVVGPRGTDRRRRRWPQGGYLCNAGRGAAARRRDCAGLLRFRRGGRRPSPRAGLQSGEDQRGDRASPPLRRGAHRLGLRRRRRHAWGLIDDDGAAQGGARPEAARAPVGVDGVAERITRHLLRLIEIYGLLLIAVLLVLFYSWLLPHTFPTVLTVQSILSDKSTVALLSLAEAIVIATGQFDLSIGYIVGISHILAVGFQVRNGLPWPLVAVIVLAIGAVIGLINALLVQVAQIDSFIATLGTGTVLYGISIWYTGGSRSSAFSPRSSSLSTGPRCSGFRCPPFGGGTHAALPLPDRGLAIVEDEGIADNCGDGIKYTWVVDVREPTNPVTIATFPTPVGDDYCAKGGHAGPHNLHENRPGSFQSSEAIFTTYQNAGVRIFDIRNPFQPAEIAHYVPPAPERLFDTRPNRPRVIQTCDVFVDRNALYVTDYNAGLYIFEYSGA
jgi:ABC-type Na+ transport system ATPase subunit NatA